jgi:putative nucleotidyltransferase with HDIG domain
MPTFRSLSRIDAYVGGVALVTLPMMVLAWGASPPLRDFWGPCVLTLLAFLLENRSTQLRGGGASGNIAFVIHLAALLLFGPFWAAVVASTSTAASQLSSGRPLTRVVFNTSQKALTILAAGAAYQIIGGTLPPAFLSEGLGASYPVVVRDTFAFLLGVVVFFVTNSVLVSWAVAISSGKSFSEVWKANTLWVLGYDIAASLIGVFVAWLYIFFDKPDQGITRFAFLAIFLPIIAVRHVYLKLNTLQALHEALRDSHEQLEQNIKEQLEMMVKSIEARDPYTSGHSVRVAKISRAIAQDYGLSDDLVSEIWNAALLHDVGKIHAEFAPLLSKEGKLTPEEWDLMKTHAERGAELVGLFSRFRGHVQESVRHHHERWDGLGYPVGLQSDTIPLGARVIMVADTIDAMTTDRPYRKALGFDVVISELRKHRGTQFSPDLVDATINSVTVRALLSEPEDLRSRDSGATVSSHRSHLSFFAGRR